MQQEFEELVKYYDRVTTKSAQKRADDRETKNLLEEHNMSEYKPSPELNGFLSDNQATKQATSDNAQLPSCEDNTDPTMREVALEMKNIAGHDENQRMISPVDKQITIEKELSTEVFTAEVSDGGRKSKFVTMVKLLVQPETLRPLFLTVSFFSFYGFGGMPSIRPFLVEVIDNFHTPIKGSWSSVSRLQRSRFEQTTDLSGNTLHFTKVTPVSSSANLTTPPDTQRLILC